MDNPMKDHILAGKALIFEIEKTLELYSPEAKKEDLQAAYNCCQRQERGCFEVGEESGFPE